MLRFREGPMSNWFQRQDNLRISVDLSARRMSERERKKAKSRNRIEMMLLPLRYTTFPICYFLILVTISDI